RHASRSGDAAEVRADAVQVDGARGHDARVAPRETPARDLDVVESDRADGAVVLGEDQIGSELRQPLLIDVVDTEGAPHETPHLAVDGGARLARIHPGGAEPRAVQDLRRRVALVGDADDLLGQPEGAGGLRRRGEQRHDAQRLRRRHGATTSWRATPSPSIPYSTTSPGCR